MDIEEILKNKQARQELWKRLQRSDVGMTNPTHSTLQSMLELGEDTATMASRLGISRALAATRRSANGRRVLDAIYKYQPDLFEDLLCLE